MTQLPQSQHNDPSFPQAPQMQQAPVEPSGAPLPSVYQNMQYQPAPSASLTMSTIGAALGAAGGAVIWFLIEHFGRVQIGYVAILVGAMAGGGAVLLGRQRSVAVGLLAAAAGLLGVVSGSYASFYTDIRSDSTRSEIRTAVFDHDPEVAGIPEPKRTEVFEKWYQEEIVAKVGYLDVIKESPKDMGFMALFGGLGLWVGYRVGAGKGE